MNAMKTIEITNRALQGAAYEWRNFAAAKVSWQQIARGMDDPAPYAWREPVRITWGGVTVLMGTIRRCDLELTGQAWRWVIDACDLLQPLEGALYFNADGELRGMPDAHISGGGGAVIDLPRAVFVGPMLRKILEGARACGLLPADLVIEVDVPGTATIWATALACDMYASVLRKLLGARPGMVSWIDYSGPAPVLRVADGDGLPAVTLDRVRDRLTDIKLSPRHDLVPPAVGVILTAGQYPCQMQVYPPGASLTQEGALTVQVGVSSNGSADPDEPEPIGSEAPAWNFTRPVVEVRGVKLPTSAADAAKWWQGKIPKLSSVPGVVYGAIKKTLIDNVDGATMSNYSSAAQAYEHVSGQLSETCKTIKWSYIELKQMVHTDTKPPKGTEMLFPHSKQVNGRTRYYNWMTWRGRTINTPRRKYRSGKGGESGADGGGDVPDHGKPPGGTGIDNWPNYLPVIKQYYEITRALPYEGSVRSLRALSPAGLVGRRLTLTGARSEYSAKTTVVQGVSVDLSGGETSISSGVPAHLSLQDMVDRVQQLATDQEIIDRVDDEEGPVTTITYDPEAYKSPPAPSVGPEGELVWAAAPDKPPVYDLQVEMDWDDDNTAVTGYRMRRGKLMLQGAYIGQTPGDDSSGWYAVEGYTSGEIWLDVKFSGNGKLTGCSVMEEQGPVNPIRLQTEEADPSEVFSYSFHIATLRDKEVHQHMLGTIQIPVNYGTFYPYGPAV